MPLYLIVNFQDEILIEEDSEIAMQSISLKRDNTDVSC